MQSVLDQQGVSVDVLVIDDASPDGSAEIVGRLPAHDGRIRVVCHAANQGHVATVNEGMAQARGEFTVLLSADDLLTPGCLARAVSLMAEHPSVGLTYGFPVVFTGDELPPARTVATSWIVWRGHDWIRQLCKNGRNVLKSPEAVIRTSVLREIGLGRSDIPHSSDFEWWMRAATVSDVAYIGGADQAYYRAHQANMHYSFGVLADADQRLRAFDAIFTERAHLLPAAGEMRCVAHQTLAREALGHAVSAYARGAAGRETADDYATFALDAWPEAKNSREWRALCRLREMRSGRSPGDLLITSETARNLRNSMLWWRQKWTGV